MSGIKGYDIGEIKAEAAFTADLILDERVSNIADAVNQQNMSRREMDLRKGMYIKYVPYHPHPVTGQIMVGGRYLFDTWEDAAEYDDWTSNVYEVGDPPEKFWQWPMWKKVDRWAWRVAGAHNFSHPETHGLHRLQRWSYDGDGVEEQLRRVYPAIRDAAQARGAAAIWLLYQPDDKLISILTVMKTPETLTAESVYDAIESLAAQHTLGYLLPMALRPRSIFDRSSLNIAVWTPVSRTAGGDEQFTPLAPVLPSVTS